MLKNPTGKTQEAEVIALKALEFLANDPERFGRFLELTGLSLQAIRKRAAEAAFLAGVLDHLRADQTLLFLFAETEGLTPGRIDAARRALPVAADDF